MDKEVFTGRESKVDISLGVVVGGLAVGTLAGLFGVGGSSFATPVLAMLGVPPVIAVASPLPATMPSAVSGSLVYGRRHEVDWRVVRLSLAGGLPLTVVGALASPYVGGQRLLLASGAVLALMGLRVLRPISTETIRKASLRRNRGWIVVAGAAVVGLLTGLLANGGGFLLIPLYLLVLGLPMRTSSGTSLAVIAGLSIPTMVTHGALGHIDWEVALAFAAGSVPAAFGGAILASRFPAERLRVAFGWLVILFATWFIYQQLSAL